MWTVAAADPRLGYFSRRSAMPPPYGVDRKDFGSSDSQLGDADICSQTQSSTWSLHPAVILSWK
ncbi:hypothetical protein, partial [Mesorhizobium sp. M2D.F.Ca.ET.140.01.1.1]|uniref:hypothetical protein n=1 Tax=Mesorhizobium sp. M2D.F.Ca.ET.140.01.1.1 TaxID=2496664 RepID=UPI001AED0E3A